MTTERLNYYGVVAVLPTCKHYYIRNSYTIHWLKKHMISLTRITVTGLSPHVGQDPFEYKSLLTDLNVLWLRMSWLVYCGRRNVEINYHVLLSGKVEAMIA